MNSEDRTPWRTIAYVFAAILFVCGAATGIYSVRTIRQNAQIRSWPRVQATVLRSEVRTTLGRGKFSRMTYVPWIEYSYQSRDKSFVGRGSAPTPLGWSKDDADEYVLGHGSGSTIHVSVNPYLGEPSFIEVDPLAPYLALVIGAGLVIGSVWIGVVAVY